MFCQCKSVQLPCPPDKSEELINKIQIELNAEIDMLSTEKDSFKIGFYVLIGFSIISLSVNAVLLRKY